MRRFGSATNFNGGPGETNHIKIVKKPAHQTQRRQQSFTSQVAVRNFETILVEMAYSTIREDVGDFDLESDDEDLDTITTEGRYTINLHAPENIRKPSDRTFDVVWEWKVKNKLQHHVNKEMIGAVSKNMSDNGYKKKFSIRGYTCAKIKHAGGKLLLRCAPTYRGFEWYDFCMVKYNDADESPAKILGFFQYQITGILMPELVDQGHSIEDIASQNMTDFSLYAVVRSAKKYLSYKEIASKFTTTFELGIGQEYLYILNADSILGPLLAVPNFDGNNNEYVTAAPYRDWGKYFTKFIEDNN